MSKLVRPSRFQERFSIMKMGYPPRRVFSTPSHKLAKVAENKNFKDRSFESKKEGAGRFGKYLDRFAAICKFRSKDTFTEEYIPNAKTQQPQIIIFTLVDEKPTRPSLADLKQSRDDTSVPTKEHDNVFLDETFWALPTYSNTSFIGTSTRRDSQTVKITDDGSYADDYILPRTIYEPPPQHSRFSWESLHGGFIDQSLFDDFECSNVDAVEEGFTSDPFEVARRFKVYRF
jgi:hypothetical protein